MKKTIKSVFLILTVFAIFSGCTKLDDELYDKIPEDKYPENPTQASLMMLPVFAPMQEFLDWGGWWFCQELTSDEMVCPVRHTDWEDGGKWIVLHQHTWTNETEAVAAMWSRFYKGVVEANKLIEDLEPFATPGSDTEVSIAKTKVMRAYYYYLLIDNYGDVPYVTNFYDAELYPTKNSKDSIFYKIVNELESNVHLIPNSTVKTSVSKGMAHALLAKLYLNAEVYTGTPQWQKAEDYCDSVIDLGNYSLETNPLNPFVTENSNSSENIFTIGYDEDTYTGFNLHMRTLHYNSDKTFNMTAGPWNGFAAMEDHYNTYDSTDLRKQGYFLVGQQYAADGSEIVDPGADGANLVFDPHIPALKMNTSANTLEEIRMSGARVVKFKIKMGAKENLSNDYPIFRYADILLMKAEAEIRQGESGDEEINMVRNRAGLSDISGTTLEDVLKERGRELFWEAHRRQDLIRFGEFNKAWWEKSPSNPDRNTFPVPQWAIDANPNLAD